MRAPLGVGASEVGMMKRLMLVTIAVVCLVSLVARADVVGTVTADYVATSTEGSARIWGGGRVGQRVRAGLYQMDVTAGTGLGAHFLGRQDVLCIDMEERLALTETYNVVPAREAPDPGTHIIPSGPMGALREARLAELMGLYYDDAMTSGFFAEALAVAVWEVLYEPFLVDVTQYDVLTWDDGLQIGFKCEDVEGAATANAWLHGLTGDPAMMADIVGFSSQNGYQDLMTLSPIGPIPEPAAMTTVFLGGLVMLRRRRR